MHRVIETLKAKNIAVGWLYAYIHFITEVACFYFLTMVTNGAWVVWLIPFVYDAFAFVPQGIIGRFCDKYPKIHIGIIGTILIALALLFQFRTRN